MSEKRFVYGVIKGSRQAHIKDCHTCKSATIDVYDDDFKYFVDVLNEQEAIIRKLQDLCGESDSENAKLRQEIKKLGEEREYWKNKTMTLLMQVRRLTSRMTDKEVKEFNKELEDGL